MLVGRGNEDGLIPVVCCRLVGGRVLGFLSLFAVFFSVGSAGNDVMTVWDTWRGGWSLFAGS